MKRSHIVLIAIFLMLFACGEGGPSKETRAAMIGTWHDESLNQTIEFLEVGRGIIGSTEFTYKWTSSSQIRIDYITGPARPITVDYKVKIDGDTLVLVWQDIVSSAAFTQTLQRVE